MLTQKDRSIILSAPLVLALLAVGCTPSARVYRNMYDGLQKREQMVNPNGGPMSQESSSYDAYQREREEILKKEPPPLP